ncbi:MAG: hypothetical protein ABSH34_34360 [Verrucomicrobiota bacterium]|jgi:hypothetical protein
MADDLPAQNELEPREPTVEDLRDLCRELNRRGARYLVVGGFAVRELQPGELQQYDVIRVADEVLVDLMCSAGGLNDEEAAGDVAVHQVDGVPIRFASPRLLWRMKAGTHREKDAADLVFLRYWFAQRGEQPPQ